MITMDNIILEGNKRLREMITPVALPLTEEDLNLGQEMLEFLKNSQNEELAEKYNLRAGVGLAAPQLDYDKRIIAVHIPEMVDVEDTETASTETTFSAVMYNPKIISHSVQQACLRDGEGCLSVERDVPGYVVRPQRITVTYFDEQGNLQKRRFKDYEAIVVQHEIDHLNGIMFYDRINQENPFQIDEKVTII